MTTMIGTEWPVKARATRPSHEGNRPPESCSDPRGRVIMSRFISAQIFIDHHVQLWAVLKHLLESTGNGQSSYSMYGPEPIPASRATKQYLQVARANLLLVTARFRVNTDTPQDTYNSSDVRSQINSSQREGRGGTPKLMTGTVAWVRTGQRISATRGLTRNSRFSLSVRSRNSLFS